MSWVITAIAVTGAVTARGQYVAGKAQEIAYKEQAKQEEIAAESQELARRQQLNEALAANVIGQSMAGISGEGTPASLAIQDAEQAGLSEATLALSDRMRQAALMRQARTANRVGQLNAASTLLQAGTSALIAKTPSETPTETG